MFQLRPAERNSWQILNGNDEPVFTGSLRQCEDWLDHQENLNRPQRRPFFSQLATRVRAAFGRMSVGAAGTVAAADKCPSRR